MATKEQTDLAKLQARIVTQGRRVQWFKVQGIDPQGAAAAEERLHEVEGAAAELGMRTTARRFGHRRRTREKGRARVDGPPRKARESD